MAERFYPFLEVVAVLVCLHGIYGKTIEVDIPTILLVVGDTIFFAVLDLCNIKSIWSVAIYPFIAIYILVKFPYSRKGFIVGNMLYILIIGIFQLMAAMLIMVLQLDVFQKDVLLCMANVIVLVLVIILHHKFYLLYQLVLRKNILLGLMGSFYFCVLVRELIAYKEKLQITMDYMMVLLIFGTMYSIVIYCWQKEKENVHRHEMELKVHRLYDESFKALLEDIRKRQHEFQNHLQAILCMHFTIHTYEELVREQEKYVGIMVEHNRYYKLLTNNWPILAGFIYGKFQEAEKEGMRVHYSFQATQESCRIPEFILVEIIGILLDNAKEEVIGKDNPVLWVDIIGADQLQISVANPLEGVQEKDLSKLFHMGYTTKNGHMGLGLAKIEEYRKQYGYHYDKCVIEYEQRKWLTIRVII